MLSSARSGRVDIPLAGYAPLQIRTCVFPASGSSQGWWPIRLCVRMAFFYKTLFHCSSITVYGSGFSIEYYLAQSSSPWRHYPSALVLCSCPTACITSSSSVSCPIYRSTFVFTDHAGSPSVDTMSLYSMADSQHRCAVHPPAFTMIHVMPSTQLTMSVHRSTVISVLTCLVTLLPGFLRLTHSVTTAYPRFATDDVAHILSDRISTC